MKRSALPLGTWRIGALRCQDGDHGGRSAERPGAAVYEEHGIPLCRVLTDRGSEYCGSPERHEYELYLAIEDIDHSRTKTKSPQTNGICERFHKTVLDEFYLVAFRKKLYRSIAELQADPDQWLRQYNEVRTHQGRWCYGKTPMQTFLDSLPMAREKLLDQQNQRVAVAC